MVYSIGFQSPYEFDVSARCIDGDRKNIEFTDDFDPVLRERFKIAGINPLTHGVPIKEETVPRKMEWGNKKYAPLDAIHINLTTVSPRLKELIEQFEPGVHQFIPVDLYHRNASEPFAQYFTLNICNRLDTVDAEHTDFEFKGNPEKGYGRYDGGGDQSKKLIFNLKQVGEQKLWRDKYLMRDSAWCADDLGDALIASGFTGLSLRHYDQV